MRWWWVVAIVFGLAAVAGFLQTRGVTQYEAQATLVVRQIRSGEPLTSTTIIEPSDVDRYAASEYLVDDYLEVVRGSVFADTVFNTIKNEPARYDPLKISEQDVNDGISSTNVITPGTLYGNIGATRVHRNMILSTYADTPDKAVAIVQAAANTLVSDPATFIGTEDKVAFRSSDSPLMKDGKLVRGTLKSDRSKKLTNAIVTALLGLLAGLALTFLLDYLDDRVRDGRDVRRQLGLDVISVPLKGKLP